MSAPKVTVVIPLYNKVISHRPARASVVTDWGYDLPDVIYLNSGLTTTITGITDPGLGLEAEILQVFVRRRLLPKLMVRDRLFGLGRMRIMI